MKISNKFCNSPSVTYNKLPVVVPNLECNAIDIIRIRASKNSLVDIMKITSNKIALSLVPL